MKRFSMMAVVLAMALGLCVMAGCSLGRATTTTAAAPTVTTSSSASTAPPADTTTTTGTAQTSETSETSGTTVAVDSEGWTTVVELTGGVNDGEKTSKIFSLSGAPARIVWKVKTDSIWTMAAFVEPEGHDLKTQGGFPVFWESKEKEGSKTLERDTGKYFLHVTVANSDWSVKIQEQK